MLSAALCFALLVPQNPGDVVINEFSYDDSGTDDREFVELYNTTNQTIDLSNWVLDADDEIYPSNNPDYTIPPGNSIAPGGFFVLGAPGVANLNLAVGAPPHQDLWENSQESLTLLDSNGVVIDTLVYEGNKGLWLGARFEGEPIWGNFASIDNLEQSWSRIRDGRDTDNNGADFFLMPSTPGTANGGGLNVGFPYFANFDAVAAETPIAEWAGSFSPMFVVDPTVQSPHNPNSIPASPQGGNCVVQWDALGGGNSSVFLGEVSGSLSYESWVYFDAIPWSNPLGEWEHFSVGFGTVETYSNTPDPSGVIGPAASSVPFTANGNTGVSWTYVKSAVPGSENILYLIDHNDGGWGAGAQTDATIIGQVAIQNGVNDGWQRLRLEVNINPTGGNYVIGSFGGTFGCADGVTFQAPIGDFGPATLYTGYRQNDGVASYVPPGVRPFTADDILVRSSSSAVALSGTAVGTNAGVPTIGVGGPPTLGNAGFTITGSGLVPSSAATLFIGVPLTPGFPLSSIGGQPGSELLVNSVASVPIPTNANGELNVPFSIGCTPGYTGATISWQLIDLDLSLAGTYRLPLGNSQRLDTTFGN